MQINLLDSVVCSESRRYSLSRRIIGRLPRLFADAQFVFVGKDDPRALQIRQLARQKNRTYETYKSYFSADNPELFCNTMISLIHQTNYLLDRQIKSLETSFIEKGGIRERMYQARKSYRAQQTEEVLSLLREVYRELAKQGNQNLMQKIEKAAIILKGRGF